MSSDPKFRVAVRRLAEGDIPVRSDVSVVLREDGSATVDLFLEGTQTSLHCLLTPEQAEALSKALIQAADRARFADATPPKTPARPRDLLSSVKPLGKPGPRPGPRRP